MLLYVFWTVFGLFYIVKNKNKKRTRAPFYEQIVTRNKLFFLHGLKSKQGKEGGVRIDPSKMTEPTL